MRYLLFFMLIVGSACCSNTEKETQENILNINIPDDFITLSADTIFSSVDYIPLETTEECVMYEIDKLRIYENEFYLLDKKQKVILVFDKNGRFMRKLDKKGKGPDEYLSLDDFFIHNSLIYILSNSMQKILIYDTFFHLKKTFNTGTYASNIDFFGDKIFLYSNFSSLQEKNIYVYNMETGKLLNNFKRFEERQRGVGYSRTTFAKDEECIYAFFPYDYNIYMLTDKEETVFTTLDFGKKNMFPNEFKDMSSDERKSYQKSRYSGFSELPIPGIDNLYISKDLLFFTFVYHMLEYSLFYNRLQDKLQFGYLKNTVQFPLAQSSHLLIENNSLYSFILPEDMIGRAEDYKEQVPAILTSLKPEDNPLICVHHFSKK